MQIKPKQPLIFKCDTCPYEFDGSGDKIHMVKIGVFHKDLCSTCKDKVVAYIMRMEKANETNNVSV